MASLAMHAVVFPALKTVRELSIGLLFQLPADPHLQEFNHLIILPAKD
jgi:hypothetical protein